MRIIFAFAILAQATTALAQAGATDAISGGAGWVGTGLFGAVLSWLMLVHIPAKDKQIVGLIESRDTFVRELTHNFRDSMQAAAMQAAVQDKERRDDYKTSLSIVVAHCEKETAQISQEIRKDLGDFGNALAAQRQLMDELLKALRQARTA